MTILEFKAQIESGNIKVDFGKAWLDLSNPLQYLLERLDEYEDWACKCEQNEKTNRPDIHDANTMKDNRVFAICEFMKLHSFILGKDLYILFENGAVRFIESRFVGMGIKSELIEPQIPADIEDPIKFELAIPSQKIVFANFFSPEVSVEHKNRYSKEFNICSLIGRINTTKHFASMGIGYGQVYNMSMYVYSNGTEIICSEHCHDDGGFGEEEDAEIAKLQTYILAGNFKLKGSICCDVWRWECIDYKEGKSKGIFKKDEQGEEKDHVTVPISGKSVRVEHYFETLATSSISNVICSHFWIK